MMTATDTVQIEIPIVLRDRLRRLDKDWQGPAKTIEALLDSLEQEKDDCLPELDLLEGEPQTDAPYLPQSEFAMPLLAVMHYNNDSRCRFIVQKILYLLGEQRADVLREGDMARYENGPRRRRCEHFIHWNRDIYAKNGIIEPIWPHGQGVRGTWTLTEKGKAQAALAASSFRKKYGFDAE